MGTHLILLQENKDEKIVLSCCSEHLWIELQQTHRVLPRDYYTDNYGFDSSVYLFTVPMGGFAICSNQLSRWDMECFVGGVPVQSAELGVSVNRHMLFATISRNAADRSSRGVQPCFMLSSQVLLGACLNETNKDST